MSNHTLIIAEAGVNHNGDIDLARRLIDAAAAAGADLIKFQTFKAELLATSVAPKAEYQIRYTDKAQSQIEMLSRLEISEKMHYQLIDHCKNRGIDFFSTAFDIPSLDFLASLNFKYFKVPSGEITNLPYLRHMGAFGRPIILSSGMSTLDEIEAALIALEGAGTPRSIITVMHCSSDYPTLMADVNLSAMNTIRNSFGVNVGYSDHTLGIEVPIAAVALGASVIEKHLTLDKNLPGPDHQASMEPYDFAKMISAIRNIEKAIGSGIKAPHQREAKNIPIVRKSIVAATKILSGEIFTSQNITTKRPGTGISPMKWDEVIGRRALRDFNFDELIEL